MSRALQFHGLPVLRQNKMHKKEVFEMKRRIFAKWGATFLLLATFFTGWAMAAAPDGEIPKNVILMIGDGMGFPQLTLGKLAKGASP